jgi:transposase-like protein
VDELSLCRGGTKHYLYRTVDQRGRLVDVPLRERHDLASAEAFFRRAVKGWVLEPDQVVSDHHQHYVKAVKGALPGATHIRTGLHRRRGETTKSIERSPVAIRDRLRCWMPAADQGARAHSRSKLDPCVSRGLRFAGRGD